MAFNFNNCPIDILEEALFHDGKCLRPEIENRPDANSPLIERSHCSFVNAFVFPGLDPRFGFGMNPSRFRSNRIAPRAVDLPTSYRRSHALAQVAGMEGNQGNIHHHIGQEGFQACVDVHHFRPSEVSVKTVDNMVIIEGHHDERNDNHGAIERHFVRKYSLPKEYDMETISSVMSSDGILTVKAPPPASASRGERHINIMQSNVPAHVDVRTNESPSSLQVLAANSNDAASHRTPASSSSTAHKGSK